MKIISIWDAAEDGNIEVVKQHIDPKAKPGVKKLSGFQLIVFGGMAVMVVTTVCGAMIGYNLHVDGPSQGSQVFLQGGTLQVFEGFVGGVIGAVVGVPIWVWLGYMVCRVKKPAELPPGPPRQDG